MKKFILFTTLICFYAMSLEVEANLKVGYDFYRSSTTRNKDNNNFTTNKYGRGFVIGVELLPLQFRNETIKLGIGTEHNFGETSARYDYKSNKNFATMTPLYATAKFTYYRPENIDLNLYTFARLGYAFAKEEFWNGTNTGGVYYGLGLGLDYKYFLTEILYDGKYSNYNGRIGKDYTLHDYHHKLGLRLGVQLGTQHLKKAQILHFLEK